MFHVATMYRCGICVGCVVGTNLRQKWNFQSGHVRGNDYFFYNRLKQGNFSANLSINAETTMSGAVVV